MSGNQDTEDPGGFHFQVRRCPACGDENHPSIEPFKVCFDRSAPREWHEILYPCPRCLAAMLRNLVQQTVPVDALLDEKEPKP